VLTLIIASYVLWQGFTMLPKTIHLLMEGTPDQLSIDEVIKSMESVEGVENIHHVHIWQLDEHLNALEAHVVVNSNELTQIEEIKSALKKLFSDRFDIGHSTLEFEHPDHNICGSYKTS